MPETVKQRAVKVVEESKEVTIDNVGVISISAAPSDDGDTFARKAEDLRGLSGTDAVFKRKVTNDLKKVASGGMEKFQRGVDGAQTKQIHEKAFLTGYDTFDVEEPPYNLEYLTKVYEMSSPHHSAVNAKVANIVGLGYTFVENSKTKRNLETIADEKKTKKTRRDLDIHKEELYELLESFNEEDTFTETLMKVWRDYEVTGNGYIEVGRKKDGTIGYVGHVPAQTLRIRRKRDGFVQISGFEVQFFAQYGHAADSNPVGGGKPNEIIHLKKHSPSNGYYGIPDIVAALGAVAGNKAAEKFNLDYFENKAVPRHVIMLKGAKLGSAAEQKVLAFFETALKGQNHRSLYIPLPGDTPENKVELKIEAIESGVQDASFVNYRAGNLSDILMVHRVPVTKISVSEGASLAVAKDADKTFKEQVCAPEQKIAQKKVGRITKELTDAFDFKLNEMSLTDEDTQSSIDERRRLTGVETANEQRIKRGDPAIEGGDELFDLNGSTKAAEKKAEETALRARDSERSSGATDSKGAARNPKGEGRTTS